MKALTRTWIEWFAALMLLVTTVFSYLYGEFGTAVIAGVCAGLVAGMQIGVWAAARKR